jgi:hypothetical protein
LCLSGLERFRAPWAQRIAGDWRNSDASASPNLVLNALILVFSLRRLMPRRHGSSTPGKLYKTELIQSFANSLVQMPRLAY